MALSFDVQDILQAYYENADYEELAASDLAAAISKARSFVTSCKRMLGLSPQEMEKQSGRLHMPDLKRVAEQLDFARRWLDNRDRDWGTCHRKYLEFPAEFRE